MIDPELALILETPGCLAVLRAYRQAQDVLETDPLVSAPLIEIAAEDSEPDCDSEADAEGPLRQRRGSRWIPRIQSVDGVGVEALSRIHGRLIAFGFLKCELGERTTGMLYQLSQSGKHALNVVVETEARAAA